MIYREIKALCKFIRARRGYYKSLRPEAPLNHYFVKAALEGIARDGFVVFPNWVSDFEAEEMFNLAHSDFELLRQGEGMISGKRWYFPNDGVYLRIASIWI